MRSFKSAWSVYVAVVAGLLAAAAPSSAQQTRDFYTGMQTGIGYSAVLPDAMLGISVWRHIPSLGFGVFVDAQRSHTNLSGDATYCPPRISPPTTPACTVRVVENEAGLLRNYRHAMVDNDEYLVFNVGGILPLTEEFALVLGAGMARHRAFREYTEIPVEDEDFQVSPTGSYIAPFETEGEWKPQLVSGMLFRAGNSFVIRFGYDTEVSGLGMGLYFAF